MSARKLNPALELPSQLVDTLRNYFGPRRLGKIDAKQSEEIMKASVRFAGEIGRILEGGEALDEESD